MRQMVVAIREQDGVIGAEETIMPTTVPMEDRNKTEEIARLRAHEIRERMRENPETNDILLIFKDPKDAVTLSAIVGFAETGPCPAFKQLKDWQREQEAAEQEEGEE